MKIATQILSLIHEVYAPQIQNLLRLLSVKEEEDYKDFPCDPRRVVDAMADNGYNEEVCSEFGIEYASDVINMSLDKFFSLLAECSEEFQYEVRKAATEFSRWENQDGSTEAHFELMSKRVLPNDTWLVHFSDNVDDILEEGFTRGTDEYDIDKLGLTTYRQDKFKTGGYNFAFLGSDWRNLRGAIFDNHGRGKYGKDCVVFQSSGVEAYHYGDDERQIIFWGPGIKPDLIYAVYRRDDEWEIGDTGYAGDRDGIMKPLKDIVEVVEWIKTNHGMIDAQRTKHQRAKTHRKLFPKNAEDAQEQKRLRRLRRDTLRREGINREKEKQRAWEKENGYVRDAY